MTTKTLYRKYRPQELKDVIGQGAVIKSLKGVLERGEAQTFMFIGPSGTGKTTLARISARLLGCAHKDVLEIDAATHTGVESMRAIQDATQYKPFGESNHRAVVIDECHMLSKSAWNSLLKVTEEPPAHMTWFFCTTEPGRVPKTIKTRAATFTLKLVTEHDLGKIYDRVCDAEDIDLPGDIGDLIIREAQGSPRQLLVNLSLCRLAGTKKEAAEVLRTAIDSDATIELCRYIAGGKGSWRKAMAIVEKVGDTNPESVRIVVCAYMAAVIKNAKSDNEACRILGILEAFSTPFNASENQAPLMLAIGRAMYSDG